MNRSNNLKLIKEKNKTFDFLIIGGGCNGLGVSIEASSRGYSVGLIEKNDFGSETSSKSTKLIHGGIRYLKMFDFKMVLTSLKERSFFLKNAPHLIEKVNLIIPFYNFFDVIYYTFGVFMYNLIFPNKDFNKIKFFNKKDLLKYFKNINPTRLYGGISFQDGKFDDSRAIITFARTASNLGSILLNYCEVISFNVNNECIADVKIHDRLNKNYISVSSNVVINATGSNVSLFLKKNKINEKINSLLSRGSHIVISEKFFSSNHGLLIPKSTDNRVIFAIPWLGKILVGTTDIPTDLPNNPTIDNNEIDFLLNEIGKYLKNKPKKKDILSVFSGLRVLISNKNENSTKFLSRESKIILSNELLISVYGGKWTTYRELSEKVVDYAIKMRLVKNSSSVSKHLKLHGYVKDIINEDYSNYGSDSVHLKNLNNNSKSLSKKFFLTENHIIWAVKKEMAQTLEDVMCRRTRCFLLDANESLRLAPIVAKIMAKELNKGDSWISNEILNFNTFYKLNFGL